MDTVGRNGKLDRANDIGNLKRENDKMTGIPAQPWMRDEEVMVTGGKRSDKGKSADAKTSKNFQRFLSVRQRLYSSTPAIARADIWDFV